MSRNFRGILLLAVIYLGYFSIGLPDGSFGLAWPAIYPELGLPVGLAGTILLFGTILSGSSGFASGRVLRKIGTGPVVAASCLLTGTGMILIGSAHGAMFLYLSAIPLGVGAGAVDAGLNSFVARHYSGRHMNWLHACWGIGATTGPLLMGWAIAHPGWRGGYWMLGCVQLTLALAFFLSLPLWKEAPLRRGAGADGSHEGRLPTLGANSKAGYLSMGAFILYVGVETMTGLWIGTGLIVGRGFSPAAAAFCTAAYYASITGGRILVGIVVDRYGNRRLIAIGLCTALAGAILFTFAGSPVAAFGALVLLGAGYAPVYPCLMHEVPARFSPEAVGTVIARQTGASYIGGATMPVAAGWFAAHAIWSLPWLTLGGTLALVACIRLLDRATPTRVSGR